MTKKAAHLLFYSIAFNSLSAWSNGYISTPPLNTQPIELPYHVTINSTKDNQMQCSNCGNNGKTLLVQGGGDIREYNFLMDTPYYLFLAQKETSPCPYTTWVAIKKTNAVPYASRFTTGCYPLKDFRSVHDKDTTKFTFYFLSGVSETIEFNNK
ncbi:hypothetical protein [Serratia ureilytica]|uniref:hypothetical protein n=1 Tax=Serratia ureilytica TaxID=300181 RepID=UPI00313DF54D